MNGYDVFLDKTRFPVTPKKLDVRIRGKNNTLNLINDGEINFLKLPGLTDINVDFLLPAHPGYPFAVYPEGFQPPEHYLTILLNLKQRVKDDVMNGVTQFIVSRVTPRGMLFDTNLRVSVEDYQILEDHREGQDVVVRVKLKQYKNFATKTIETQESGSAVVNVTRETANAPQARSVTIQSGDTLWAIAKRYNVQGGYMAIAQANNISNPHLIFPGQVFTIP